MAKRLKTSISGAMYTREQTGHSITVWLLLSLTGIGFIIFLYYLFSPRHYSHL
ncbi:MAG: hypothetical protein IJ662_10260 [Clostridia bacterium]|nr:hypothetical protein [Clostridia bacterium]